MPVTVFLLPDGPDLVEDFPQAFAGFGIMMLMNCWTTFAMLTGTALAISLLGLPLTIHYEQVRGELLAGDDAPRGKESESREYFMGGAYIAFLNDEAETEVPVGRTYAAALKHTLGL